MPARYVIHKELSLILSVGEGVLTFSEMKSHQDGLLADPDLDRKFDQLLDLTRVTNMTISVEEAKMLARRAVLSTESRRAVVAGEKAVFGMYRLMQTYHEMTEGHSHIGIFYDREEALKWLGIRADSLLIWI